MRFSVVGRANDQKSLDQQIQASAAYIYSNDNKYIHIYIVLA